MIKIIVTGNINWVLEATLKSIKGIYNLETGMYSVHDYVFNHGKVDSLYAVKFDINDKELSLDNFLEVFYTIHSPFINKWGDLNCFYPMCRSSIFSYDEKLINLFKDHIYLLNKKNLFPEPIDTKVDFIKDSNFKSDPIENQNFFTRFPNDPLSLTIIKSKMEKIESKLPHLLKKDI